MRMTDAARDLITSTEELLRTTPTSLTIHHDDTTDLLKAPRYDLGVPTNTGIFVISLILGCGAMILNLGVMTFNWRNLKEQRIVPFLYFILSLSDCATGLCALLHALVFAVLLLGDGGSSGNTLFTLLVPAYFLTSVAFRVSAFVSMVFAVTRTVNIVSPFSLINKAAVCWSIGLITLLWSGMFLTELIVALRTTLGGYSTVAEKQVLGLFIPNYFYQPTRPRLVEIWTVAVLGLNIEQARVMFGNQDILCNWYSVHRAAGFRV